ncbi:MAG: DUF411 domain-containing protein [Alphaproteobacteria bacterium]|nr:DUF411 domain-containing protein [Alphaproteobacteria bacterium]
MRSGVARSRRHVLAGALAAIAAATWRVPKAAGADQLAVRVYRDPGCGCCGAWAEHLAAAGFDVSVLARDDMATVKRDSGVPDALASCHTAHVGGYVVEGHVPADDIKRMLRERLPIVGLSVTGMPVGSPGMESPGLPAEPFDVLAFDRAGRVTVFRTVPAGAGAGRGG